MESSLLNGWIPLECYVRQDHEAIEVGLNQKLALHISRLCCQPMAIGSVDATQCYDHMAHNTSSICVQWWEVVPITIGNMLLTIQLMEFYLHMAFGDSMECFSHRGTPLQGLCQGNKGAPAMWLCISTVLVAMMHREGAMCHQPQSSNDSSNPSLHQIYLSQ